MLRQIVHFPAFQALRHALIGLVVIGAAALASPPANSQDAGRSRSPAATNRYGDPVQPAAVPGEFDFYVLALSWSPSFCEAASERNANRRPDQQCSGRPYAFVVHGLWPQYERGFPSSCQKPSPRVARAQVDQMLDLMPSPRLVYHEWDRHGTCSGLDSASYFEAIRKARGKIAVPAAFHESNAVRNVAPGDVANAFVTANPGLTKNSLAVTCDDKRLTGVRVCMTKDFQFRECPEVVRRACQRDNVVMPAMRLSHAADVR